MGANKLETIAANLPRFFSESVVMLNLRNGSYTYNRSCWHCWNICPRCVRTRRENTAKEYEAQCNRLAEFDQKSYGVLTATEYLAKRSEIDRRIKELYCEMQETENENAFNHDLRERYEIHMGSDAKLHVSYSCSCVTCGWKVDFNQVVIPTEGE